MVLSFVTTAWNLFLVFIFLVLPIAFLYGFFKKEEAPTPKSDTETQDKIQPKEKEHYPVPETYRTVKKEAGSYLVVGPDNSEAVVVRVDTPNEGKLWVAALAVKNNTNSVRVPTKKQAVAAAIEMLKEHKGKTDGP